MGKDKFVRAGRRKEPQDAAAADNSAARADSDEPDVRVFMHGS